MQLRTASAASARPTRPSAAMPSPLRILMLCYEFPPIGGGGSKVVAGLAAELLRQGHRVELVTSRWPDRPAAAIPQGLVVHEIAAPRRRHDRSNPLELLCYVLLAHRTVRALLRGGGYDVCNAHFVYPDGLVRLARPGRARWC